MCDYVAFDLAKRIETRKGKNTFRITKSNEFALKLVHSFKQFFVCQFSFASTLEISFAYEQQTSTIQKLSEKKNNSLRQNFRRQSVKWKTFIDLCKLTYSFILVHSRKYMIWKSGNFWIGFVFQAKKNYLQANFCSLCRIKTVCSNVITIGFLRLSSQCDWGILVV